MSGATTAALWTAAGIATASSVAGIYSSNKQAKAQRKATKQAEREAQATAERARQEQRRKNTNEADVSGILAQNSDATSMGGSTLLTGAQGVNKGNLNLGQGNTLG